MEEIKDYCAHRAPGQFTDGVFCLSLEIGKAEKEPAESQRLQPWVMNCEGWQRHTHRAVGLKTLPIFVLSEPADSMFFTWGVSSGTAAAGPPSWPHSGAQQELEVLTLESKADLPPNLPPTPTCTKRPVFLQRVIDLSTQTIVSSSLAVNTPSCSAWTAQNSFPSREEGYKSRLSSSLVWEESQADRSHPVPSSWPAAERVINI